MSWEKIGLPQWRCTWKEEGGREEPDGRGEKVNPAEGGKRCLNIPCLCCAVISENPGAADSGAKRIEEMINLRNGLCSLERI